MGGKLPEGLVLIDKKGLRIDGRKPDEMRPVKMEAGVVKNADGSAYVEMGKTRVLAAVYGPREVHPRHKMKDDTGIIQVQYRMVPFSTTDRKRPGPDRRSIEIAKVMRCALEPVVMLREFPMLGLDIFVDVIQADAGTRVTALNAASLALADAGIPMKGLVASCAAGKAGGKVVLDLCGKEDNYGEADLPIATTSNGGDITLMQLDGDLDDKEFKEAMELAKKGNKELIKMQEEALRRRYK